jgi:autophagy-related protein 5
MHVRPPSIDAGGVPERDSTYTVRCVPVRIYLPDGPFIQELVPPLLEDGKYYYPDLIPFYPYVSSTGTPHTLYHFLSAHLPLLFPSRSVPPVSSRVNPSSQYTGDLAYALVQGVVSPPEAEIAWLGACLTGADGWLNICIGVNRA